MSAPSRPACPTNCHACDLRSRPAFTQLPGGALDAINDARSGTAGFPAGTTLISEGQRSQHVMTLYAGWAFRYKTLADGRRQILNFMLPGDLIGLQQKFDEAAEHGVELLTDGVLCMFKSANLWQIYRDQPRLSYDITWLAANAQTYVDDTLVTVGRRTALERVAMLLMHLYRRLDRIGEATDGSIAFPLTQQHIADSLGLSLVHTNKTLRRLAQLGLHQIKGGRLTIDNPRALASVAEYYDSPPALLPLL